MKRKTAPASDNNAKKPKYAPKIHLRADGVSAPKSKTGRAKTVSDGLTHSKQAATAKDGVKPATAQHAPMSAKTILNRQDRKQMKQDRSAQKKHYRLAKEVTVKWEKIRQHNISKEERAALVTSVLEQVKGKVVEMSSNHITSRVLQACAKYGSGEQRATMLAEVLPELVTMAKSPYGHFTVRKLIATAPKASVPALLKAVRGQVPALLRHPSGCSVLEELYDVASAAQRDALMAEFYGREYVLFELPERGPGGNGGLASLWGTMEPPKRRSVLQHMVAHVLPVVEKGLVHSALAHRLLHEYMLHAPGGALDDIITGLSGDIMMRYIHTRDGAAVGCMVLAYGTPKDRKKTLKAMKAHVKTMAVDEHASLVLITALQVVDDTSLARKCIISELQGELSQYATHRWAHRVLLALLAPTKPRHWPPSIRNVIQPPQKMARKCTTFADGQAELNGNAAAEADADAAHLAPLTLGQQLQQQSNEGQELQNGEEGDGPQVQSDEDMGILDDEFEAAERAEGTSTRGQTKDIDTADTDTDTDDDIQEAGPLAMGDGDDGGLQGVLGASKKNARLRRLELLSGEKSIAGGLGRMLVDAVQQHCGEWLRNGPASSVVEEVALGGEDGVLTELCGGLSGLLPLHTGIAEAATAASAALTDKAQGAEATAAQQVVVPLEDFFGSRALRRVVLAATGDSICQEAAQQLAAQLWTISLKGKCKRWVGTHADKVLAALVLGSKLKMHKAVKKELAAIVPGNIKEWAQDKCPHTRK